MFKKRSENANRICIIIGTFKSISELKKGDKVAFYGAVMKVTKDAYISSNFIGDVVYIAKCNLIDNGHASLNNLDVLRNYGYFQGTKEVEYLIIK